MHGIMVCVHCKKKQDINSEHQCSEMKEKGIPSQRITGFSSVHFQHKVEPDASEMDPRDTSGIVTAK